jgi:hypothetical protein
MFCVFYTCLSYKTWSIYIDTYVKFVVNTRISVMISFPASWNSKRAGFLRTYTLPISHDVQYEQQSANTILIIILKYSYSEYKK